MRLQGWERWPSPAQPQTSPAERTAHNLLLLLGVRAPSPVSIGAPAEPSVPGSPQTPPSPPGHPHTATSLQKQGQHSQEEERNPLESGLRSYAEFSLLAASTSTLFHLPAVGLSHPGATPAEWVCLWPPHGPSVQILPPRAITIPLPKAALLVCCGKLPIREDDGAFGNIMKAERYPLCVAASWKGEN